MSGWLRWTVLFVSCWAGHVAGQLHEPLNVKIESRNFSLFLTWLPAPENPSSVTYEVQYTNFSDDNDGADNYIWTPVPACENISITECDFTCVLMDFWDWTHKIQVRTTYPSRSSWVQIQDIQYMFTVDPDPPNLNITQEEGSITITAFTQKPFCVPEIILHRSLNYIVVIKREYNLKEQIKLEQELDGPSITWKTLGYNGEYCVTAKTKFTCDTIKESKFSHPVCLNFTKKDGYNHIGIFAAVLIFGAVVVIFVLIWYKINGISKKPKALDFSNNKYYLKDPCLRDLYSDIYHSLTTYHIEEQDSSTKFMLPNKYDDGVNVYPVSGQGYMERHTMQSSGSHSQEYFSSKGSAFNSSSDKSSTDCSCPNTSGSVTDMLFQAKNDQTNDCPKENNINVSGNVEMFSFTSLSVSHFDSLSILDPNSLVNVPLNTLHVEDINEHMDNSDGVSGNHCFTDSEDDTDFTDYKMSNSKSSSEDKKTNENSSSGYTQRTYMSRR